MLTYFPQTTSTAMASARAAIHEGYWRIDGSTKVSSPCADSRTIRSLESSYSHLTSETARIEDGRAWPTVRGRKR